MVMETPGPQEVGREFVRQYYTMLHEAPLHLHRFYSNNSAFVHGGVEKAGNEQPPVIGQEAIHKKIVSLGFNDCHAKIRQVDSQATVEDSVVVQVTGELSNNGEPMRRFMQTFVLVPQMPKKFYVHNDIFRYQDEVFHDEDGDQEEDKFITDPRQQENGSLQETATPVVAQDVPTGYYDQMPLSNGTAHEVEPLKAPEPAAPTTPPAAVAVAAPQVPVAAPESDSSATVSSVETPSVEEVSSEEQKVEPKPTPAAPAEPPQPEYQEPSAGIQKPVTWAALASKNTSSGMSVPPSSAFPAVPAATHHVSKAPPARTEAPKAETSAPAQQPQAQRAPRPPRERVVADRNSVSRGDGDGDSDSVNGRRSNSAGGGGGNIGTKYADNQQLFVGNLPLNITERELKAFFEQYGKVEELRINTKIGGGKVPNFGFVVFESPETVQRILEEKATKPIKYNGEHRLNVEEKKPRGGDGMRGGRGGMSRGNMGGQMRSGASYGVSGGRGGMKNGGGGGFNRPDMRGSPNLGPRGGMSQQGRR